MANPVWHVALGIELHLDEDDLGHPGIPGLWERLYQQDRLYAAERVPVSSRGLQCAGVCREQGVVAWMYLRQRANGRREAVHEHAEDERRHRPVESDEHKAYKDRIVRVAVADGHQADTEVAAPGRRIITDAMVYGPAGLRIGWEVQLSNPDESGPRDVRSRAKKARELGITPAWHTDRRDFDRRTDAHWTRTDRLPAEAIRTAGELTVWTGVRRLIWERCDFTRALPCPALRRGRCGHLHARPEPHPMPFDDLVRGTASGLFVPLDFQLAKRINRFWVPAADRERYLDAHDGAIEEPQEEKAPSGHGSHRGPTCRPRIEVRTEELAEPAVSTVAPPTPRGTPYQCSTGNPPCGAPARLFPCGWRCPIHTPAALAGKPEVPSGPGWPRDRKEQER